jgi:hypothetical protein
MAQTNDNIGKGVLADPRARAAISAITKTDSEIWELVKLCSQAKLQMLTFQQNLVYKRELFEYLQQHRHNVDQLRQFVAKSFRIIENWPVSENECQQALDHIEALIGLHQQAAQSDMVDRGVTRKSKGDVAAQTAAIGWLAEQVEKTFGAPFVPQVAILAEVALGIGAVLEDRVRHALKARKQKREHQVVRSAP